MATFRCVLSTEVTPVPLFSTFRASIAVPLNQNGIFRRLKDRGAKTGN